MKLYLRGHDYKYAAEQMLLTLFPGQRPLYPAEPPAEGEDFLVLTLTRENGRAEGEAQLRWQGKTYASRDSIPDPGEPGETEADRAYQQLLKLCFYRCGTAALGREPPWGAMTGVRPVKIPTKALLRGESEAEAERRLREIYHVTPQRVRLAMDCARASVAARKSLRPDEVSLYVGIPFCPTRCAYCSFISADVKRALQLLEPYLDALEREIAAAGDLLRRSGLFVRTIYFGGGTPTTLSAPQLERVMGALEAHLDLSRLTEYTVEAGRPDTITPEKLSVLRSHGVGRVSVNPQSMSDEVLAAMGRSHTAADIRRAMADVRAAGFGVVNMDLIAGLPRDSAAGFAASLEEVLSLAPENITVHTLALKKGSRLMADPEALPSAGAVSAMLDGADEALRGAGYVPYYLYRQKYMSGSFENVGWCRPGTENLYNIAMMEELHTVLALGGGGMTKLVDPDSGRILRIPNAKYPYEYIQSIETCLAEKEALTAFYAGMKKEGPHGLSAAGN